MRKKGYTVLEISIVATLGIFLLLILARWVGYLGNISIEQATTENEVNALYSLSLLDDDINSLARCDLKTSFIKNIQNNLIKFDIYKDNFFYQVIWSIEPGEKVLYRYQQEYSSQCNLIGEVNKTFITANISNGTADIPAFIPISNSTSVTNEEKYGECINLLFSRCNINSISVILVFNEYSQKYSHYKTFLLKTK